MKQSFIYLFYILLLTSCSVSYTFTGTTVNYDVTKTISIRDFPNHARLVYGPLAQKFTEELKNKFITQTRLQMVETDADLELEGEITGYETTELAVKGDGFASQTRLTMTVKVRYVNNKNPHEDLEQTFSAYQEYDNRETLDAVQDRLIEDMIKDLTDEIFNATLGNW